MWNNIMSAAFGLTAIINGPLKNSEKWHGGGGGHKNSYKEVIIVKQKEGNGFYTGL
jgi:hypothetical protein